jgi:large subunit ribosomal protein L18
MKTNKSMQSYLKRKRRTNVTLKAQHPDYRCVVVKSLKHISVQLIDAKGHIVASASDLKISKGTKTEKALEVGKILAKNALEKKVSSCVFDRNGFLYHGRVKSLCEGLRQ